VKYSVSHRHCGDGLEIKVGRYAESAHVQVPDSPPDGPHDHSPPHQASGRLASSHDYLRCRARIRLLVAILRATLGHVRPGDRHHGVAEIEHGTLQDRLPWDHPPVSLRGWLGKRRSPRPAGPLSTTHADPTPPPQRPTLTFSLSGSPLVKLAGTTTFCAEAAYGLVRRRGLTGQGLLEEPALVEREPSNAADPNAVAVLVEGERIGYLPSGVAGSLRLDERTAQAVPMQLAYLVEGETARVEAWVWLGSDLSPRWQYSIENLPPMTPQEKRTGEHLVRREMVAEALAGGGDHAKAFEAGMVSGVHYLELIEPIKQLKRDDRLEEALELCYAAIQGAEGDRAGSTPAPWYTEQAAIIHRKLRQPDREAAVLERWLAFVPVEQRDSTKLGQRLAKLKN